MKSICPVAVLIGTMLASGLAGCASDLDPQTAAQLDKLRKESADFNANLSKWFDQQPARLAQARELRRARVEAFDALPLGSKFRDLPEELLADQMNSTETHGHVHVQLVYDGIGYLYFDGPDPRPGSLALTAKQRTY
jgi:hypothetical protein